MNEPAEAVPAALRVDPLLRDFVEEELLPGLEISAADFWSGFADIVAELTPTNRALLRQRDELQRQIDAWHRNSNTFDADAYRAFLKTIGYLEPAGAPFQITTENVDPEIAIVAGPQLVVPVSNARFALNAANARWGSLYDALYGTDVIPATDGRETGEGYNPTRGAAVVEFATAFLDEVIPLDSGSHADVTGYRVSQTDDHAELTIELGKPVRTALKFPRQFRGFAAGGERLQLLFCNHGLHIEISIDPNHPIGAESAAGVCDVFIESAVSTIQDCEDSVAAVDAEDKVGVYRNWLGLMRGDLTATFHKSGQEHVRELAPDRHYTDIHGETLTIPGRSLMLVRNVGHLMTTPAVHDANGDEVYEGILDAVMTTACAMHDLKRQGELKNSRAGSVYIVKPKMHGPQEVEFADTLFARVEDLFGLKRNTLKIGVMDEERRTTVNLEECIRKVRRRLVFINTGFLDRTGDEIHTSMLAGPMLPKEQMKAEQWIADYEDRNVDVGIHCGLPGKAQIGKGMWPKPDEMQQMLKTKQAHPEAGANCAWVPSPTAATLHAMHYHHVDVAAIQKSLKSRAMTTLDAILTPPIADSADLDAETIRRELEGNAQSILGYVVRWIDQGVGCSKVPDINDVGLMEDRATLRISSQLIANWLHHGITSRADVLAVFKRMALIVDEQNRADPSYQPMAPDFDGTAFSAACALVFEGERQPNGYTEPLLHAFRQKKKATQARS